MHRKHVVLVAAAVAVNGRVVCLLARIQLYVPLCVCACAYTHIHMYVYENKCVSKRVRD